MGSLSLYSDYLDFFTLVCPVLVDRSLFPSVIIVEVYIILFPSFIFFSYVLGGIFIFCDSLLS